MFANAESLFYYAKEGRPSKRTLTQQEIQALLAQVTPSTEAETTPTDEPHKEGNKETDNEMDNSVLGSNEPSVEEQLFLNTGLDDESSVSLYPDTDSSQPATPLSTSNGPPTPHSSTPPPSSACEESGRSDPYTAPLEALPTLHTLQK